MSDALYRNERYQSALLADGTREEILAWLQWNDKGGGRIGRAPSGPRVRCARQWEWT